MESKTKLCQRCHHSFIGNTLNCKDCLNKMKTNRLLLKNKREAAGTCNHCGKSIENPIYKTCDKCRHDIYAIKKRCIENQKIVTVEDISNLLRRTFIKHKTENRYTIMSELQVGLELLGIKYSNDVWK